MLTIQSFVKLSKIRLRNGLIVESIHELEGSYSIWLSDKTNIELERKPHWQNGGNSFYTIWYAGPISTKVDKEAVMPEMINTIGRMREYIIYLYDKYNIPF